MTINQTIGNYELITDESAGEKLVIRHIVTGNETVINDGGMSVDREMNLPKYADPTNAPQDERSLIYVDGTGPKSSGIYRHDGDSYVSVSGGVTRGVKIETTTVSNTTTETEIKRSTVKEGDLSVGSVFDVYTYGMYSNDTSSDTFDLRVYIGSTGFDPTAGEGTSISDVSTVTGAVSNAPFNLETVATVYDDSASGTIRTHSLATFNNTRNDKHQSATIDTTRDVDVVVTIQWGNAKTANTATVAQAFLDQKS